MYDHPFYTNILLTTFTLQPSTVLLASTLHHISIIFSRSIHPSPMLMIPVIKQYHHALGRTGKMGGAAAALGDKRKATPIKVKSRQERAKRRRVISTPASDSDSVAVKWTCPSCTFDNLKDHLTCVGCENIRPDPAPKTKQKTRKRKRKGICY
jgi:hypothetical protein